MQESTNLACYDQNIRGEDLVVYVKLIKPQELGLSRIHLEGYSLQVVNLIQREEETNSMVGVILVDVNRLRHGFEELKVSFVRRVGNSVAHSVAKNAMRG